ncbi:MAG: hypothetical protein JNM70_22015, partial [Anaerolineae bacterium]|nr:hypothetical protein [Anaerolineae bacterium]
PCPIVVARITELQLHRLQQLQQPCLACKALGAQSPFRNCRNCRNCRNNPSGMDDLDDILDISSVLAISCSDFSDDSQDSHILILTFLIISHLSPHFSINYKLSTMNFSPLTDTNDIGGTDDIAAICDKSPTPLYGYKLSANSYQLFENGRTPP